MQLHHVMFCIISCRFDFIEDRTEYLKSFAYLKILRRHAIQRHTLILLPREQRRVESNAIGTEFVIICLIQFQRWFEQRER